MHLVQDDVISMQIRGAWEFYETIPRYFSSLSYNARSIVAARIGWDKLAYAYFIEAAGVDLDGLHGANREMHAGALGGVWQTIVYGFVGMRLLAGGISFEPRLPEAWKSLSLRIAYRGYRLHLNLSHHGHRIEVDGAEGLTKAKLILDGETHVLEDKLSITSFDTVLQ